MHEDTLEYEVVVDTVDPQPTLSVRGPVAVADIQSAVGERTRRVWEHLQEEGGRPAGPPFTRHHAVDGDEADLEVGFPVAGDVEGGGEVEPGRLPGGEVIRTVHRGPYGGLVRAGEALDRWLAEHGREARGPNWEVYRVNAGTVDDPSEFETDVVKPIR